MTSATDLCAKVVTTLGSRLRSRAMVTFAALLGLAGLATWPLIALPTAQAEPAPGALSAKIAPVAPAGRSATTVSSMISRTAACSGVSVPSRCPLGRHHSSRPPRLRRAMTAVKACPF